MRPVLTTIGLLILSNVFMTFAWYGHLKNLSNRAWYIAAAASWGVAFFEYMLQVPANRIGFQGNGGPFTLFQLKIIQEVVSLTVFTVFALTFFKTETFRWNHLMAFVCMVMAVYFIFKK